MTRAEAHGSFGAGDDMEDPAGATAQLAVLAVAMVLAMSTWFAAAAVLTELRDEFGLSRTEGSWLTIAVQLGFVAGAVGAAVANLPDLVSPRRLMLVGAIIAAAANLTLLVAPDLPAAMAGRAITGAGLALVYPPALKAASTWLLMIPFQDAEKPENSTFSTSSQVSPPKAR